MPIITVHAGDFDKGEASFFLGDFQLKTAGQIEIISPSKLETVDVVSEESVKRMSGTIGWGAVGALALGPIGLLAGVLAGGRKKEVTFAAKFKDGRKMFATTDSDTFIKLQAAVFK